VPGQVLFGFQVGEFSLVSGLFAFPPPSISLPPGEGGLLGSAIAIRGLWGSATVTPPLAH